MRLLLLRCSLVAAAFISDVFAKPKGGQNKGDGKAGVGKLMSNELDPRDPHAQGFEPRPGPDEGGDIWTFGTAHAAVTHAMKTVDEGDMVNASEVRQRLHDFAELHDLHGKLGLPGLAGARVLDGVVRAALTEPERPRLQILVMDAGIGGHVLQLLPALLDGIGARPEPLPHEIVSVENKDTHAAHGMELIRHALSDPQAASAVTHTPLLPGEGTTFDEVLESLREGDDLEHFDVVLLGNGERAQQLRQLETLVERNALRPGSRVHAVGPGPETEETGWFLDALRSGGVQQSRFDHEIHTVEDGRAAVVSTFRGRGEL